MRGSVMISGALNAPCPPSTMNAGTPSAIAAGTNQPTPPSAIEDALNARKRNLIVEP